MKANIFIFVLIFFVPKSNAQTVFRTGYDLTMEGYIFTIKNRIFFQPLDFNRKEEFLKSLDNRNFLLMPEKDNFYEESLNGIGRKIIFEEYSDSFSYIKSKVQSYDSLHYFKALLKLNIQFLDTVDMKVLPQGRYNFFVKDISYRFFGVFVRSEIYDIIPERKEYIKKMYEYYKFKNLGKPAWLEKRFKELYPQKGKSTKI